MKLVDLNPRWMIDDGRTVGVTFDCPGPCCEGKRSSRDDFDGFDDVKRRAGCPFTIALDGSSYRDDGWARMGDTLETLTLAPSVWISPPTHAHGFVRNGEWVPA